MEEKTVITSGVAAPAKMPEPMVQKVSHGEDWFVQVVSGYTLAVTMVSMLSFWYLVASQMLA